MADRYWNPAGAANWGDANVWALTDGGTADQATPTSADDVFFTSTNVNNCTLTTTTNCRNISFTGGTGYTGTFGGIVTFNIAGNLTFNAGMTLGNCTLTFTATSGTKTITYAGKTSLDVRFNGSGGTFQALDTMRVNGDITLTAGTFDPNGKIVMLTGNTTTKAIVGSLTFYDLTIVGSAVKNKAVTFSGNQTITGTLTINGNSAINRELIRSDTIGTARTLTAATVTVTNADFQDITGAGAGSWNLSAVSGGSGDCGGNTGVTFTTPVTTNWQSGTTWSTATWSTRVPLPQDTATFTTAGTVTITQDMPRIGSVDFSTSANKTWTTSTACSCYGSIDLTNLATLTASTQTYTFMGRSTYTLTSATKSFAKNLTINAPSGKITLNDALVTTGGLDLTFGEFDANDVAVTVGYFQSTNSNIRTLRMGTGLWTLTANASNPWNTNTTTNLTFFPETSTIKLTGTGQNMSFYGGGKTYNNFWNATTGAYTVTIQGSNTFNDFRSDGSRQINFTNSTTTTMTSLTVPETVGNVVTFRNSSSTTHATLAKAGGGVIDVDYMDVNYITGSPASTWYMGANSTDGGSNTTVYFTVPPTTEIKSLNGLAYASTKTVNGLAIASVKTWGGLA